MVWVYALIGLVVGLIIGALAMRYGNKTMRQQDAIKAELDTKKKNLIHIATSLSATLLEVLNYWTIWRKTTANFINTWQKAPMS